MNNILKNLARLLVYLQFVLIISSCSSQEAEIGLYYKSAKYNSSKFRVLEGNMKSYVCDIEKLNFKSGPGENYQNLQNPPSIARLQNVSILHRLDNSSWFQVSYKEQIGYLLGYNLCTEFNGKVVKLLEPIDAKKIGSNGNIAVASNSDFNINSQINQTQVKREVEESNNNIKFFDNFSKIIDVFNQSNDDSTQETEQLSAKDNSSQQSSAQNSTIGGKREQIIALGEKFVGFSYWWGGGKLDPNATFAERGSCSGGKHSGKNGADCSGYIAKIWQVKAALPLEKQVHPYNSSNFTQDGDEWKQISRADILPADGMGKVGHVLIVKSVLSSGRVVALEAKGCRWGITNKARSVGAIYKAVRLNNL